MVEFSITYNGITINKDNLITNGIAIDRFGGTDGLEIRTSEEPLTGGDGGNIWNSLYNMRTIFLEGWLYSYDGTLDGYWAVKKDLVDAFKITSNTELLMTKWGETTNTKAIDANVIGAPMIIEEPGEITHARWRVELKCEEAYFKDASDTVYTIYLVDSDKIGGPVQTTVPMALGGGGATNSQVINNTGDVDWYLDNIKFNGTVTIPRLTNTTNGQAIYLDDNLGAAEYVNISKSQSGFSALDNTGANVLADVVGDYPVIEQGNNGLVFSASTYSATASCVLTWRNRYLSL